MVDEVAVNRMVVSPRTPPPGEGRVTMTFDKAKIDGVEIEHTTSRRPLTAEPPISENARIKVNGVDIAINQPIGSTRPTLTVGGVAINNPELAAEALAAVSGSLRYMKFTTAEAQNIRKVAERIKGAAK